MRVIGGNWRGRRLTAPPGDSIRPTTDRVKEALFNILGPAVRDTMFLDLCCGAGGLGIEALSRGAGRVIFVDKAATSLEAVRKNLECCGAEAAAVRFVRDDVGPWLDRWTAPAVGSWIAVADPPYAAGLAEAIMSRLESWVDHPGFVAGVVEHGRSTPGMIGGGTDAAWETRIYGESVLALLRPTPRGSSGKE